jgi:hypothetical protein
MYYEYNGIPAQWDGKGGTIPKLFVGGEWTPYYKLDKFWSEAQKISKDEFNELVAQQQRSGEQ